MRRTVFTVLPVLVLSLAGGVLAAEPFIDPGVITATSSSVNYGLVPTATCNGNGLSGDLHTSNIGGDPPSAEQATMWLANGTAGEWIRYEFDKVYAINLMWVWNYNQNNPERTARGIKECTIEYSTDGAAWTQLGGAQTFAKADGSNTYAHNSEIDFGGVRAQYVKITVVNNYGNAATGLSEVRFYAGDNVGFDTEASGAKEDITPAEIPIVLSSAQTMAVTVDYAVTGGTAAAGDDFTLGAGTLVFEPGETEKTVSINVVNDGVNEDDETIELTLSNATGGEVELGIPEHTYTIIDPRPAVQFDTNTGKGTENAQIIHRPRRIAVSLSEPAASAVTVDYAATGGNATRGMDYNLTDGTLTFAPGEQTADISLTVIDDSLEESDETVVFELSNAAGAKFGANTQHTYTILDDDTGAEPPNVDLNNDGNADFQDLIIFLDSWLECTLHPKELCWQ